MTIHEINSKLEKKALQLAPQANQLNFSAFLTSPKIVGSYTNYPGDGDEMQTMLESNLDIVENKIALADEAYFILKNNLKEIDEAKQPATKELMLKIQELVANLHTLKDLYESMIVEPGIILIDDGEREDSDSFHVEINPPTYLSKEQATKISKNWKTLLTQTEESVSAQLNLNLNL